MGLYLTIADAIEALWDATWAHPDVPVYWRANDADPLPDPSDTPHFIRAEIDFGAERVRAFGGGRFENERLQFGSVVLWVFTSRAVGNERTALDLMADAVAIYRSVRTDNLSFIGQGSGFSQGPAEDGGWFIRGSLVVFEYRFTG